jgi:hypothetical protein
METPNPEPISAAVASLRMLVDDEAEIFEHGHLPALVWRDSGWQNDRPSRFARALRNAWRGV